jgi:molecular chaperone GrpE (heat shock protein)
LIIFLEKALKIKKIFMKKDIKIGIGAVIFRGDKILVCRDNKKWGGKWLIPGGKMEYGENIEDAIKREVKEETGLDIYDICVKNTKSVFNPKEFHKKGVHFLMIDCVCKTDSKEVELNDEHIDCKWVTPKNALSLDLIRYSKEPIKKALEEAEKEDYLEGWRRCKADFDNFKKKVNEATKEVAERSKEAVILDFLPILDNFNLAIRHVDKKDRNKPWVEGIFYIKKQFEDLLEKEGVFEIECRGKEFDPNCHECIEEIEDDNKDIKPGCVTGVAQKGYMKNGKIVRAAKVKVKK